MKLSELCKKIRLSTNSIKKKNALTMGKRRKTNEL